MTTLSISYEQPFHRGDHYRRMETNQCKNSMQRLARLLKPSNIWGDLEGFFFTVGDCNSSILFVSGNVVAIYN